MKLTCSIIDDEPLAISLLESYVKKTPFLELNASYASALEAANILEEYPVNILFLDIQMPELNGLEFSRMLPESTRIIFTTAFEQYAIEGFRVNALDYLLKPISYNDFIGAVNKAIKWFELNSVNNSPNNIIAYDNIYDNFIYVKSDYKLLHINIDDIVYIEGLKDYVKIYVEGKERPIISLVSMKNMEEKLPSNKFMRVHRSFIVQKSKIKIVDKFRIVFGNTYIPISDTYKQSFIDYIDNHIV